MKPYVITLAVICVFTFLLSLGPKDPITALLLYFATPALLLSFLGFAYFYTHQKIFGYMALVGLFVFFPLSAFGLTAIRNEMDKIARNNFIRSLNNE